jgi:hypothetical protein
MIIEGLEVLLTRPDFKQILNRQAQEVQMMVDISHAQRVVGFPGNRPRQTLSFQFESLNQVEAIQLRNFHRDRNGRLEPFWVPSWNYDLPCHQNISQGATSIPITNVNFGSVMLPDSDVYRSGRYIFIYDFENDPEFLKVNSVTVSGSKEILNLDSAVSRNYRQKRFIIGLAYLVRFSNDDFETRCRSIDVFSTQIGMLEVLGHKWGVNGIDDGVDQGKYPDDPLTITPGFTYTIVTPETYIFAFLDSSGSMNDELAAISDAMDTLKATLRDQIWGGDQDEADDHIRIIESGTERWLDWMADPESYTGDLSGLDEVIVLAFINESNQYHTTPYNGIVYSSYISHQSDFAAIKPGRSLFKGKVYAVNPGIGDSWYDNYQAFIAHLAAAVDGTGNYASYPISDIYYDLDVPAGQDASVYFDDIQEFLEP